MQDKNVQLVDEIMQTVTQTDVWTEELTNDPVIKEAEEEVEAVMEEVRGYIPLELFLRLDEAIAYKSVAYHEPAILYGMRVAYALMDVCRRPSDLSRSIMERVKEARA